MNRRDFMEATLAGVAAVQLPGLPRLSSTDPENPVPRARRLRNGLIDAGGTHEPYLFVVRRGGQPPDARQEYEREQSEDLIRRLRDQGIEVFHTHLYKGFGMAAEKPEMEDTRRAAEIAHRYGLKSESCRRMERSPASSTSARQEP